MKPGNLAFLLNILYHLPGCDAKRKHSYCLDTFKLRLDIDCRGALSFP